MARARLAWVVVAMGVTLAAATTPARADIHRRKVATTLSGVGVGVSSALVLSSVLVNGAGADVNHPLLYAGIGTSIVTPSLGEFYAHQYLTIGEGVRVGGAALALIALTRTETVSCASGNGTCTNVTNSGIVLFSFAAIAFIGGCAWDVLDAGDAVDRYDLRVSVVPMVVPSGGGFAVAGRW
jgi:hypothetical protein